MSAFYQAMAMFFFLLGCGCLTTCLYLWRQHPLIHTFQMKKKQQKMENETVILHEEWEECIWKSTNHTKTNG